MGERKVFVYRLVVTYPEGSREPGWRPPDWDGWSEWDEQRPDGSTGFQWPGVRLYLSKGRADARAEMLRKFGSTVTVLRSNPVEWST